MVFLPMSVEYYMHSSVKRIDRVRIFCFQGVKSGLGFL